MTSLGIIGTAFRGKDTDYDSILTRDLYLDKIYPKALEVVKDLNVDTVISGGAAGIDHLAVILFKYIIRSIKIYYPTNFKDTTSLIAKTLLKYHYLFSNIVYDNPYTSITELLQVYLDSYYLTQIDFIQEPISSKYEGFFSRNKKIASNSDYLLVFSYFDNGNCLTNGTRSTIDLFLQRKPRTNIIKIDIRELV